MSTLKSKLFGWLRLRVFKFDKPLYATWEEWETWNDDYAKLHPTKHWITERLPVLLSIFHQRTIGRVSDLKYYLLNRYSGRTHLIETSLPKGKYYSVGDKILYGCFAELCDFVEIEISTKYIRDDDKKLMFPGVNEYFIKKFTNWRSMRGGVTHLEGEMRLDIEEGNGYHSQAQAARETFELYMWWKVIRPNRPDSTEASGLNELYARFDEKYGKDNWGLFTKTKLGDDQQSELHAVISLASKLDSEYQKEDDEMLHRLIKHRETLWS